VEWIRVQDKSPEIGQIVVVWLQNLRAPCCVRYEIDKFGPVWVELVEIDRWDVRNSDLVTHWMPLPEPAKEE
jgi:hypothetical protein